ncbi:MAG TPA: hypothetical protein PKY85_03740, partial [Nitrosomonas sp.]|nr:hypothetical protein [Nitrosomonas sp.]
PCAAHRFVQFAVCSNEFRRHRYRIVKFGQRRIGKLRARIQNALRDGFDGFLLFISRLRPREVVVDDGIWNSSVDWVRGACAPQMIDCPVFSSIR